MVSKSLCVPLQKLQEKKYSRLRKASSYEYESVDEAMGMSLEQLAKDSKELYFDFAIFDEDVKIPAKVCFYLVIYNLLYLDSLISRNWKTSCRLKCTMADIAQLKRHQR